jgi:transcription termination factor Rho
LSGQDDLQIFLALAGVRPEEIPAWEAGPVKPATKVSLTASSEAQSHAVEVVIDQARRLAARGEHALALIDTLQGVHGGAARRALGAARNIVGGGSLTVIATASEPLGGETTVIALDVGLTSAGRFPALDLAASGTIKPELLVGEAGAAAITSARAEVLDGPE